MRHAPQEDDELLIIEPITWLDGSPVRQRRRLVAPAWSGTLARPGMLALCEGLAILGCFSLPWFSMNVSPPGGQPEPGLIVSSVLSFNGWGIARGMPLNNGAGGQVSVNLFVHLWLIPLAAAALFVVTWAQAQSRLSARLASGAILALSALALLVELGYCLQITSLGSVMASSSGSGSPIQVAWGCWLAVGLSVVAMVVAASAVRPSSVGGAPATAD